MATRFCTVVHDGVQRIICIFKGQDAVELQRVVGASFGLPADDVAGLEDSTGRVLPISAVPQVVGMLPEGPLRLIVMPSVAGTVRRATVHTA